MNRDGATVVYESDSRRRQSQWIEFPPVVVELRFGRFSFFVLRRITILASAALLSIGCVPGPRCGPTEDRICRASEPSDCRCGERCGSTVECRANEVCVRYSSDRGYGVCVDRNWAAGAGSSGGGSDGGSGGGTCTGSCPPAPTSVNSVCAMRSPIVCFGGCCDSCTPYSCSEYAACGSPYPEDCERSIVVSSNGNVYGRGCYRLNSSGDGWIGDSECIRQAALQARRDCCGY